ncbi:MULTISPECIES: tryptophan 7-halogenase [Asticcacaulis]|uniref:tryptophan 7-halogenase n=1 Tax=Asticcacaulis TaxID=76890 RepID=UPI001AE65581|nr:tryptophan 7-halogenase [Asticcacaulis sp. BE141]MBP2161220.1 tryptophan halogenase [Asticcacaulis solisilvae]MDR6802265.1 tryptophan halogenase [Asticcacaulis sp. BE141]
MANSAISPGTPLKHIAICGGGLAGYMTAAALLRHLPAAIEITLITPRDYPASDIFYGSVTSPSAYDFNLSIGVSEPRLVLESTTAFSLGTHFQAWGGDKLSWFQGFQLPLPILSGVPFHQYLVRQDMQALDPFLISAAMARRGVFAHPPENASHPLARAEYGYQLDVASYRQLFAGLTDRSRIRTLSADLAEVESTPESIVTLYLSDGQSVSADLFIDCTGPEATLLSTLGARRIGNHWLNAVLTSKASEHLGPAVRTLSGRHFGWQSATPLQGSLAKLTVFTEEGEASALAEHGEEPDVRTGARFGRQPCAWVGNCVAIGQAAAMIEPLTPAPIMLLQKDIDRLVSLIPLSGDMSMESREFNRQFVDDCEHAELFRRALFATAPLPRSSYWQADGALGSSPKLDRKFEQFLSRGVLVAYDLEPFTPEDWVVLHYGMGRRPRRYDRLADQAPAPELKQYLDTLRRDIEAATYNLPSHDSYMTRLRQYLMRQGA